jgi:hypothetical protein
MTRPTMTRARCGETGSARTSACAYGAAEDGYRIRATSRSSSNWFVPVPELASEPIALRTLAVVTSWAMSALLKGRERFEWRSTGGRSCSRHLAAIPFRLR